jgi:hypothetical protein
MTFITEIEKSTLKFIWKHKKPWVAKTILSTKSNAKGVTITKFKLYYRVIAIKIAWYWHKNRHEKQWNRIEDPDKKPCSYVHLFCDKGIPNMEKRQLFNKYFSGNRIYACRKLKLDPCLWWCTNINSRWIKNLNVRLEMLKLVQERVGNTL